MTPVVTEPNHCATIAGFSTCLGQQTDAEAAFDIRFELCLRSELAVEHTPRGARGEAHTRPRISTGIWYDDPKAAIEWLCKAFGFQVQLLVEGEGGRVEHSELTLGDGLIMVGGHKPEKFPHAKPPALVDGANTQNMMVFVDDVDAHCRHARTCGATITMEPETHDYGADYWTDRTYECRDIGGHHWWFVQRLRTKGD